ncbi:MAG: hypothetical protein Q7J35_02370 [Candidatus Methanoperedens sp.]|nr:hypothetical protein [Candidatus Methanoperedens sp.]
MVGTIHLRVPRDIFEFWGRIEDGRRSREARRWFGYWFSMEGEDSEEKWQQVIDEHQPIIELAKKRKEEIRERKRQACVEQENQHQQKEKNLKKLMEAFCAIYDYRVQDVPPSVIKHYAGLLEISTEEIKKLLATEAKKKGMT